MKRIVHTCLVLTTFAGHVRKDRLGRVNAVAVAPGRQGRPQQTEKG